MSREFFYTKHTVLGTDLNKCLCSWGAFCLSSTGLMQEHIVQLNCYICRASNSELITVPYQPVMATAMMLLSARFEFSFIVDVGAESKFL
jgi:hypothetical protein